MSVTISVLLSWKPGSLSAIVTDLLSDQKALQNLEDDMRAARPTIDWVGDDADAARDSHDDLYDRAVDLAAETRGVAKGVDAAEVDMKKAKSDLKAALAVAQTNDITVNRQSLVLTWDSQAEDADVKKTKAEEVSRDLTDALSLATTADSDLARVLSTALVGGYDAKGDLEDLGAANTMTDSQLAKWMLEHPGRGKSLLDALPEEVQQEVGKQMGSNLTTLAKDDDLTQAEIDAYNKTLEAYADNKVVSTSLLNRVGPQGLTDLTANLSGQFRGDLDNTMQDELGDLQRNLGTVLDKGTEGLTKEGQKGDEDNVSDEWLKKFLVEGRKKHPVDWPTTVHTPRGPLDGTHSQEEYGYQLLAPYLRNVDNSYLLNQVGDDLLDMETNRDFSKSHLDLDTDGTDAFETIRKSIWDRPNMNSELRFDFTQENADGSPGDKGRDPMNALLDGLSNNPQAMRDFLSGDNVDVTFVDGTEEVEIQGPRGGTAEVPVLGEHNLSRTDYLLTDRSMSNDTAAQLTDAIRSATSDDPADPAAQRQVRDILNETIRSLGEDEQMRNQPDGDQRTLTDEQKEDLPSHENVNRIHPGLRVGLSEILGDNYDAVSETVTDSFTGDPAGRHGLTLDVDDLKNVLTEVGRDETGAQNIKEKGFEYEATQLTKNPSDNNTERLAGRLEDVYQAIGKGEDLGIEKSIDGEIEDHNGKVDLANKAQSYLATGVSLGAPSPVSVAAAVVSNEIVGPAINDLRRDGETRIELTLAQREQFRDKFPAHLMEQAQADIQAGRDPLKVR